MRSSILYISLITLLLMTSSCSKDESFITFSAKEISFVSKEGTSLVPGSCVDPSLEYFVKIDVNAHGSGSVKPSKIEYTVNGELYSTTFTAYQSKSIPISLKTGENIVELVADGSSSAITITDQGDFELVE